MMKMFLLIYWKNLRGKEGCVWLEFSSVNQLQKHKYGLFQMKKKNKTYSQESIVQGK